MVLERLSISISISIQSQRLDSTAPTRRAVEILATGDAEPDQREAAFARLALPAKTPIHALAVPPSESLSRSSAPPHALVGTRFGIVRAVLVTAETPIAARAGVGTTARTAAEIHESWRSALIALRLTDPSRPVLRAADLGVLLRLAESEDQRSSPHPDVIAIDRALAAQWTEALLREIAGGASRRALAALAGVHHSTVEARLRKLPALLGYDPTLPWGRTRLDASLMLHRLARTGIGED